MVEGLSVTERHSPGLRCAVCHDGGGALVECSACGTSFHITCRGALDRCPTIGCRALAPRSGRTRAAMYTAARDGAERLSFRYAVALSAITGVAALGGLAAYAAVEYESGYVPGLCRAAGIVLTLVHYFYAPARWAVRYRGERTASSAAVTALVTVVLALAVAGGLAISLVLPLMLVGLALALAAPALGAWNGAGERSRARPQEGARPLRDERPPRMTESAPDPKGQDPEPAGETPPPIA